VSQPVINSSLYYTITDIRIYKTRLNFRNDYHRSLRYVSSSRLLSKNIKIKVCKSIILPVVWYGCETWSLTLNENKLRVTENRVLRRMFGGWKRLHNENIYNLFASPDIIRMIK
jgi:hypothetical protein